MPITLLASACPAVQISTAFNTRLAAYSSATGTAPSARSFAPGDTTGVAAKLNENALLTDLAFRYGGGAIRAIGQGLVLSFATGTATVSAGQAVIDGVAEIAVAASGVGVSPGVNYLWLSQISGAVSVINVPASTTPPNATCVYLGAITVSSGVGTVDTSGVVYARDGFRWRQTADANAPSDSPPGTVTLLTKTLGGTYLWDGLAWQLAGSAGAAYYLATLPHTSTDATTHDNLKTLNGVHWTDADRAQYAQSNSLSAVRSTTEFGAVTFATLRALLDSLRVYIEGLWNIRTADPTAAGVASGWVLTKDTDGIVKFLRPATGSGAPTAHATTHATGGTDPVTPVSIGAEATANKAVANGYADLDAAGKIPLARLPASVVGGVNFVGAWNASTNTPTLATGTGTRGAFYIVSVAGTTTLDGISSWAVGDQVVFDGVKWARITAAAATVTSVNGATGAVVVTPTSIGASLASHTHDASAVVTGSLDPLRLTASGAAAGAYTNANITVDVAGRVTAVSSGTGGGGGGTAPNATVSVVGISRLSAAPTVATDPIAVGVNDSRLADARAPTAHATTHATGAADPITPASIGAEVAINKGAANGYAALGSDGKVPATQLPASSGVVSTLNGLAGAVSIAGAGGIAVGVSGSTITLTQGAGGGGTATPRAAFRMVLLQGASGTGATGGQGQDVFPYADDGATVLYYTPSTLRVRCETPPSSASFSVTSQWSTGVGAFSANNIRNRTVTAGNREPTTGGTISAMIYYPQSGDKCLAYINNWGGAAGVSIVQEFTVTTTNPGL